MSKINVIVVFGGRSVEHDISIITGVQVLNNLDLNKYNVFPIYISKKNQFFYSTNFFKIKTFSDNNFLQEKHCFNVSFNGNSLYRKRGVFNKKIASIDFAFLATHGGMVENGGLQGFFDILNIPYSSCGVVQSAVGMNKYLTKCYLQSKSLPYVNGIILQDSKKPDYGLIYKLNFPLKLDKESNLKLPLVVKPCSLGSSIGISFCKTKTQVKNAISFAKLFDNSIIVEEAINNLKEVNIAVVGNEYNCEFSDIEEVIKTDDILSFENKYLTNSVGKGMENTKRVLPANIDKELKIKIENIATEIYVGLKCKGIIRFDFLIDTKTNEVYLNEFNTIPGSLANYLWQTKGYNFKTLLNKIYDYCIQSYNKENEKLKNFSSSVLENVNKNSLLKLNK